MHTYDTATELLKAWPNPRAIKLQVPELVYWIGYHPQIIGATGLMAKFEFAVPQEGCEGWLAGLQRFEAELETLGYKMTRELVWRVWERADVA